LNVIYKVTGWGAGCLGKKGLFSACFGHFSTKVLQEIRCCWQEIAALLYQKRPTNQLLKKIPGPLIKRTGMKEKFASPIHGTFTGRGTGDIVLLINAHSS
jgi:hypothetical protein